MNPRLHLAVFALASACGPRATPRDEAIEATRLPPPVETPAATRAPPSIETAEAATGPAPAERHQPVGDVGKTADCPVPELSWQAEPSVGLTIRYCEKTHRVSLDDGTDTTYRFMLDPDFDLQLADDYDGTCRQAVGVRRFRDLFVVYLTCAYGEELRVAEERVVLARRAEGEELEILWSGMAVERIERDQCVYTSWYSLACHEGRLRITFEEDQHLVEQPDEQDVPHCPIMSSSKEVASIADVCPPSQ